jgi:hypothetical protein
MTEPAGLHKIAATFRLSYGLGKRDGDWSAMGRASLRFVIPAKAGIQLTDSLILQVRMRFLISLAMSKHERRSGRRFLHIRLE